MGEKIRKKINSKDGASISFALFAFIIATVVSLVIVAAALTNVIKLRQERENEQAYLATESIAYLIMDQVLATDDGTVGVGNKNTKRYVRIFDTDGTDAGVKVSTPVGTDSTIYFNEPFKSALEEQIRKRYISVKNGMGPDTTGTEIKVSIADGAPEALKEKMDNAVITCYMTNTTIADVSDNYDLEFVIKVPSYGSHFYVCRLECPASVDTKDNNSFVYWKSASIEKRKGTE